MLESEATALALRAPEEHAAVGVAEPARPRHVGAVPARVRPHPVMGGGAVGRARVPHELFRFDVSREIVKQKFTRLVQVEQRLIQAIRESERENNYWAI